MATTPKPTSPSGGEDGAVKHFSQDPAVEAVLGPLDNAPLQAFHMKTILMSACGWIQAGWEFAMFNNIVTMLSFTKFYDRKGGMPQSYVDGLRVSLYAGTLVGQLFWGFMGDKLGRKRMFVAENIYIVAGLVLSATATWGEGKTVVALWVMWRVLLGFGLGGEYPLVACLTAEFACKRWRGSLVSLVWACQSVGYVLSAAVGLALVRAFKSSMDTCVRGQPCDALDRVWRLCLIVSLVPAVIIFLIRNNLPESPRFTLFSMMNAANARRDVVETMALDRDSLSSLPSGRMIPEQTFWSYLREPGVGKKLIGCMTSWFLRDVTFITIMLWGSTFLSKGFDKVVKIKPGLVPGHTIYDFWYQIFWGWTLFYFATNITGYFLGTILIDLVGRRVLQASGFFLSGVFMGAAAILDRQLSAKGFAIMLMMALLIANAGPNLTVFVIPAELFKTKFRCRCHSMAAASGRLGAIVSFVCMDRLVRSSKDGASQTLGILAGLSLLGVFTTMLLPETKNRSLEELSGDTYGQDDLMDSRLGVSPPVSPISDRKSADVKETKLH